MTDTTDNAKPASGALSAMRLAELQSLASELGVKGISKMRKSDLVEAIRTTTGEPVSGAGATSRRRPAQKSAPKKAGAQKQTESTAPVAAAAAAPVTAAVAPATASATTDSAAAPSTGEDRAARLAELAEAVAQPRSRRAGRDQGAPAEEGQGDGEAGGRQGQGRQPKQDRSGNAPGRDGGAREAGGRDGSGREGGGRGDSRRDNRQRDNGPRNEGPRADGNRDDERGSRRRRGRDRGRDRKRRGRGQGPDMDLENVEVTETDVLLPVAGILDILDNYAFVRTSGYLAGPNDVYVSLNQVKKAGLRRGDAITGAVRQPREGEEPPSGKNARNKFNALVRLDTVNGMTPDEAKGRAEFNNLTPLYPQERLRLENPEASKLTPRVIDIVAPIGKGQRGLIVAPPKAGKTLMMQQIANSITSNNPEVHLMVVLVDERPEEVTDFSRSVQGEVISSTFDRHASDHTLVAELAIERAKRLVELGQDVVVLLDGITRLSRAYNLAAPASGRILSGGVDAAALYPPKKFFGAARNIEHGGSLTILATALVETGSKMDEVIFEEFKGTGNMELRLSRSLAEKRIFPAIDVNASSTRREEILMSKEELSIVYKLRRVMGALDTQQATELLLGKLKEHRTNVEFLMEVQKTTPGKLTDERPGETV
ncbi:transcription termination factor Rho [Myceligenerans indicum]|uniref:Transcription termination factor Rho n=1 Tax=Myceligenerans indicum TaxID=2593663 RepID=A0ABS1LI64_9MICO|nr:transcription termination factor Rho [Myceligenerans indicum]MBL0885833.1 transcription termination factor Rho [Myceligenerans indicum]